MCIIALLSYRAYCFIKINYKEGARYFSIASRPSGQGSSRNLFGSNHQKEAWRDGRTRGQVAIPVWATLTGP